MIKRTYEELEPYFPAGHFGVTCKRYHGKLAVHTVNNSSDT